MTPQITQQAMTENPIELRNRCSDFEASDSDEEEEVNDEDFDEEKSDMYSLPPSNPSDDQWHVTDTDIDEDDEVESLSDGEAHETSAAICVQRRSSVVVYAICCCSSPDQSFACWYGCSSESCVWLWRLHTSETYMCVHFVFKLLIIQILL